MVLPVAPIDYPRALAGQSNGKLPASILTTVPSLHGGKATTLLTVGARSFVAMRDASERAGVRLESVSSYRTYAQQEAIFRERYVPYWTRHTDGSVRRKWWQGRWWYHAHGATAAAPGQSNHGLALAVDYVRSARWLAWMLNNAARFGWSWEIQSEEWHLRYVAGDNIPAAVLAYERSIKPKPPAPLLEETPPMTLVYVEGPNFYRLVTPWAIVELTPEEGYALDKSNSGLTAVKMSAALWTKVTDDYSGPRP